MNTRDLVGKLPRATRDVVGNHPALQDVGSPPLLTIKVADAHPFWAELVELVAKAWPAAMLAHVAATVNEPAGNKYHTSPAARGPCSGRSPRYGLVRVVTPAATAAASSSRARSVANTVGGVAAPLMHSVSDHYNLPRRARRARGVSVSDDNGEEADERSRSALEGSIAECQSMLNEQEDRREIPSLVDVAGSRQGPNFARNGGIVTCTGRPVFLDTTRPPQAESQTLKLLKQSRNVQSRPVNTLQRAFRNVESIQPYLPLKDPAAGSQLLNSSRLAM